ncbi:MAG: hypothetical protein QMD17_00010 [Rhodocyclaceae bacterium]|jgi:hypothetical protein|nr:hypothetical protein [Rhodocyclaceae bacterium]
MHIGGRNAGTVNQAGLAVSVDMHLHAEMPLLAVTTRSGSPENRHWGSVAVVKEDGTPFNSLMAQTGILRPFVQERIAHVVS